MKKHNTQKNGDQQDGASIVLRMIKPRSTVLEFGCSDGHITRYMKQKLECCVNIVEMDESLYRDAMNYAEKGYLGDIEGFEWVKTFTGMTFDYIVFLDVLEYLHDPEKVLYLAKNFLAEHGQILLSVPNVAHDSIIINLINDKFQYVNQARPNLKQIHFFTYYSLKQILTSCGLVSTSETEIYMEPEQTQYCNDWSMAGVVSRNTPLMRERGNTCQFVYTCVKNTALDNHQHALTSFMKASNYKKNLGNLNIYIKKKGDYSLKPQIKVDFFEGESIEINLSKFKKNEGVKMVMSKSSCIIIVNSISIDGTFLDCKNLVGNYSIKNEREYIFFDHDPYFVFDEFQKLPNRIWLDLSIEKFYVGESLIAHIENIHSKNKDLAREMGVYRSNYHEAIRVNDNILAMYNGIEQSTIWKMTKPVRKILDKVRRTKLGGLAYKVAYYIKNTGISNTFRVICVKLFPVQMDKYCRRKIAKQNKENFGNIGMSFSKMIEIFEQHNRKIYLKSEILKLDEPRKKPVLVVNHEMTLTGAPIAVAYMTYALKNLGYDPVVVSPFDGQMTSEFTKEGIPVIIDPEHLFINYIDMIAELFTFCVCSTCVTYYQVNALAKTSIPILWWIHEAQCSYAMGGLSKLLPKQIPDNVRVYCGGNYAKKILHSYRPAFKANTLLYYVPDLLPIYENLTDYYDDDRFAGRIVFAVVGTFEERKAQSVLGDAIRLLPNSVREKACFIFVGRYCSEDINENISSLVEQYPNDVIHIEELTRMDLLRFYRNVDCIVCTSKDDPMPVFITEAMLLSKLIICSEFTGSADILNECKAGLIYQNNSVKELSGLVVDIVLGKVDKDTLQMNARKAYKKFFSATQFTMNLWDAINGTVKGIDTNYFDGVVSVVFPTYNPGSELDVAVSVLKEQIGVKKVEIILVDSGTSEERRSDAYRDADKIIDISQEEFTHSFARNLGAENAIGEVLIFMTQDAIPLGKHWVANMIAPIINEENIAAVSCVEVCPEDTDLYYKIASRYHFGYVLGGKPYLEGEYNKSMNTMEVRRNASLSDIATAIRKSVFEKYQYRFQFAEDLDLGVRLIKDSYKIIITSAEKIIHGHNRSAGYYIKRSSVEGSTLNTILGGVIIPPSTIQDAVNQITTCFRVLTNVLHSLHDIPTQKTPEQYIEQISAAFRRYVSLDVIDLQIHFEELSDPVVLDVLHTIASWDIPFTPDKTIIGHVIWYHENHLRNYVLESVFYFSEKQAKSITDALLKDACMETGGLLSRITDDKRAQVLVARLGKGV